MSVVLQSVDLVGMSEGTAIGLIGLLAILLVAIIQFRNPAAMIMWGVTVLIMLMTSIYGLADEFLWLSLIGTTILIIVGAAARVMQGGGI